MKKAKQVNLKALIALADKAAKAAKGEYQRAVVALRKELLYQIDRRNLAGNAEARDAVIAIANREILKLKKRLDRIMDAQAVASARAGYAGAQAEFDGGEMGDKFTVVKYSPEHAQMIIDTVKARGGASMAAVFTQAMSNSVTSALRRATVEAFNEQAVAGMTKRELANVIKEKWAAAVKDTDNLSFVDKSGRVWNTSNYMMMNVRTNSMAIYNDVVVDTIARTTGGDLVRISDDGGTEDSCDACQEWAGRIVSITGKTHGFPTLEEARAAGMFHPNCVHTLEPIDDELNADEIKAQKKQ